MIKLLKIAALAAAVMLPFSANATTLATFKISNGTWSIGPTTQTYVDANGNTVNAVSQATITGDWEGELLMPLPTGMAMDYTISAALTASSADLGGTVIDVADSVDINVDLGDIIPDALAIGGLLVAGAGTPLDFGVGQLIYNGTLDVNTATKVGGTFSINALGQFPLGDLANNFLAGLNLPLPVDFFLPNDDSGMFSLELSIAKPQPIPLPAGGVLLLSGLGLAAMMRRRKAAA